MLKKLKPTSIIFSLFISPWVLSIAICALLLNFLPNFSSKYSFRIARIVDINSTDIKHHSDLDGDGNSETIFLKNNGLGFTTLIVKDYYGFTKGWYNTKAYKKDSGFQPFIHDLNQDGKKEIYIITYRNDSLFLYAYDHNIKDFFIYDKFIDKIALRHNNIDYFVGRSESIQLPEYEHLHMFFSINAGLSIYPRKVYKFDINTGNLISSPQLSLSKEFSVFNHNGSPGIVITTSTVNNMQDTTGYSDHQAWLYLLDSDLQFMAKPSLISRKKSSPFVFPLYRNDSVYFLVDENVLTQEFESKILVFNAKGEKVKDLGEYLMKYQYSGNFISISKGHRREIYQYSEGKMYAWDRNNFDFSKNRKLQIIHKSAKMRALDLNRDGFSEIYSYDDQSKYISDFNLKHTIELNQEQLPSISENNSSYFLQKDKPVQYFFRNGNKGYYLEYKKNSYYWLRFPYYLGLYIITALIIWLIQHLQKKQTEAKFAIEKRIADLQLKSLNNQIDPHFTFNALNTLGAAIRKEDKELAYKYLTKFSSLLRISLMDSNRINRSLKEELDFVKAYLELQQYRFKNFDFSIELGSDVNREISLPKMMIQLHVENAIKHGIRSFTEGGIIKIEVSKSHKSIVIIIADNGVGRKASARNKTYSTGFGQGITDELSQLLEKHHNQKIEQKISDLEENGIPKGTKVEIKVS